MHCKHPLIAASLLLLMTTPGALAQECRMPTLDSSQPGAGKPAAAIDSDRAALLRYEACLAEEQSLLEALRAGSPERAARQREAAANLRRTLDAWQETMRAADLAKQRSGS